MCCLYYNKIGLLQFVILHNHIFAWFYRFQNYRFQSNFSPFLFCFSINKKLKHTIFGLRFYVNRCICIILNF